MNSKNDKYKKHILTGYIDDLWFLVRRLRDMKIIFSETMSLGELTAAQSKIVRFIRKLEESETKKDEWQSGKRSIACCEKEISELKQQRDDLLETLKRAYFLLETNKIKDEYFEVLRLRLGDLLPSQIVSEEMMKAAIANTF